MTTWHRPHGSLSDADGPVRLRADQAGWEYSGLQVIDRDAAVALDGVEAVIVPLSARDVTVRVDGEDYRLAGRDGVFAAVSDWLYAPVGSTLEFTGVRGEVAICTARADKRYPVHYGAASDVPVELRGGGQASRQVTNIATPGSFAGTDRINVCEVLTPGGNWSSWPPHRHDGIGDCPVANEEIYYFRIGNQDSDHGDPTGQGLFRVYTVDESVDDTVVIGDGDVYLVPEGYHGPSAAAPGYPMYFLNVLAGPGAERSMAFCDDPSHHWIRGSWTDIDARLPMTSAHGRVR